MKKKVNLVKEFFFEKAEDYSFFLEEPELLENFITKCVTLARRSIELKYFIRYLKEEVNLNSCYFFENISLTENVEIEMHHYPFSLFDITEIIVRDLLINKPKESFSSFLVASTVVKLHYEKLIGLIPLSKTVHQLAHAGKLSIPFNSIFGNVDKFLIKYKSFIDIDKLKQIEKILNESNKTINENNKILNKKILYNNDQVEFKNKILKMIEEKEVNK